MSNLLNFKFGQYTNLPTNVTAGSVYVTTDEKAMYVDLPNAEGTTERFRIGDIVVKNSVRDAQPPFYKNAFYYFVEENALLRWNSTGGENGTGAWVKVNSRQDLESDIAAMGAKVDKLVTDVAANTKAIADLNTAVGKKLATADFETFKTTNTAAIADAKKAGTDAASAASAAQTKADKAETDAAAAQSAADTAQTKANQAYTLAEGKATLTDVETAGYAKKTYVDTEVGKVNTKVTNLSTKVDGVKTTADNALSRVNGGTMRAAIDMDRHKIINLLRPTEDTDAANKKYVDDKIAAGIASNDAMTFKGVVGGEGNLANLPTSGVQKGDTYKVGAMGTYGPVRSLQAAKVGDLFINSGEDNATPVWVHISSGYEDDYLQKLGADAANGKIYLNDGVNNSAASGSVQFVSANSGLELKVTNGGLGGAHVVTASLVWESF